VISESCDFLNADLFARHHLLEGCVTNSALRQPPVSSAGTAPRAAD
jgi:hypothetical protein